MAFKMAMAANAEAAEQPAAPALPIDLSHLHRQTMGDRHLQREVLKMFMRYSREQIERLKTAQSIEARREAAHSLVGSAKGIGAFTIASIAAEIEGAKGPVDGRLRLLEAAAAAARTFFEDYLAV
jgi:HPt (histidine-containing phosphotransfer) domain-containing protein